ncbi:unnamed protein product, partial [marine sediment metagenome]
PIYNTFMPLIVNVQSERESYHFIFQRGRAVSLYDGSHKNPDVTISGNHTELIYLLQRKDRNRFIMDEKTGVDSAKISIGIIFFICSKQVPSFNSD